MPRLNSVLFQIRQTQAKIKHTLTERWYAWEDAWKVAEKDPEVNLKADLENPAYQPRSLEVCNCCTIFMNHIC